MPCLLWLLHSNSRQKLLLTRPAGVRPRRVPRLPRPQEQENWVLGQSVEVFTVVNLRKRNDFQLKQMLEKKTIVHRNRQKICFCWFNCPWKSQSSVLYPPNLMTIGPCLIVGRRGHSKTKIEWNCSFFSGQKESIAIKWFLFKIA